MIRGLHHNAYRCRDSEQTRAFYEGFLGLPLAAALEIAETKSGRKTETLHTFYRLGDGSYLAFFEAPDMPFEFKVQHDYDLHIALEVDNDTLHEMLARGKAARIDTRGVSDHGFIHSIYFRDPNGYVIELTAKTPDSRRRDGSGLERRARETRSLGRRQAAGPRRVTTSPSGRDGAYFPPRSNDALRRKCAVCAATSLANSMPMWLRGNSRWSSSPGITVSLTATVPSFASSKCAKNCPMPRRRVPAIVPSAPGPCQRRCTGAVTSPSRWGPRTGIMTGQRSTPRAALHPFSGDPSSTAFPLKRPGYSFNTR